MFGKKGSMQTRRETFVKLHDISKEFELLISKANKDKFKTYLIDVNEKIKFSILNDKKLNEKAVKKMFKMLHEIHSLLNHELWYSKKIKKKLHLVDEMVNQLIT